MFLDKIVQGGERGGSGEHGSMAHVVLLRHYLHLLRCHNRVVMKPKLYALKLKPKRLNPDP